MTLKRLALVAAAALGGLYLLAALAPGLLAPGDPTATDPLNTLAPPSPAHWFGTDQSGRDVYTRVIHGTASTLGSGLAATAVAAVIGGLLGTLSAFGPRWERGLALRLTEVGQAIPEFLLALLLLAFIGKGSTPVVFAVALAALPGYARIAALSARTALTSDAVLAARVVGVSRWRLLWRHVVPTAFRPVMAVAVLGAAAAMLAIAGLTFLGLGVDPATPDWGVMLSQGKTGVRRAPWAVLWPGLALAGAAVLLTITYRTLQKRGRHD